MTNLARLKTLEGQGNASERALQAAQAADLRDRLAVQSANDRLALSWGKAVADQKDPPGFIQSLTSLESPSMESSSRARRWFGLRAQAGNYIDGSFKRIYA